jgi:hypothetical protein
VLSLRVYTQWCDKCFAETQHYLQTRSPKMLALGTTCKVCRKKVQASTCSRNRRAAERPLREIARAERSKAKLKQEAEILAIAQAARVTARFAPRFCPRCCVVTDRVHNGSRSTRCVICEQKRIAERRTREAGVKSAARAAASPRGLKKHIANPQAPCPSGHHDWAPSGYCRACLRIRNRHGRSDTEKCAVAMCKRAKFRAIRDGLPFSIGPADISPFLPNCPCCGDPFELDVHARRRSLDKKVPALGYISGNVEVICVECNSIKGASTSARRMQCVADRQRQIEIV